MIYAAELRRKAREAMKAYLPFALLVTLLASLPSLVLQMAVSFSGNSIVNAITQYQYADLSMNVVRRILNAASQSMLPAVRTLWIMVPFLYLALPFLNVGRMYFSLRMLRGADASVSDLLARVNCFFKAILLEIIVLLKMVLWAIPGFIVMFLGTLLLVSGGSQSMFMFLYFVGMALMAVLLVRANLHYMLAPILMADIPEKSAMKCLRESIEMMKKRTMELFSLIITFVLYLLLSELIVSLLSAVSYSIGLIASLLINLVITCYMNTTVCAYYEERMKIIRKAEEAQAAQGPEPSELP